MGTQVKWIGADGSEWDLATGAQGVILDTDFEGLEWPEITHLWDETGSLLLGSKTGNLAPTARVIVGPDLTGPAWRTLNQRWHNSLSPYKDGILQVNWWNLPCRLRATPGTSFFYDPTENFSDQPTQLLPLISYRSYWQSGTHYATLSKQAAGNSLSTSSYSKMEAQASGVIRVKSPLGYPTYPVYKIKGPTAGPLPVQSRLRIGDDVKLLGRALTASEILTIDTDPATRSMTLTSGNSVTSGWSIADVRFVPVGPEELKQWSISPASVGVGGYVNITLPRLSPSPFV